MPGVIEDWELAQLRLIGDRSTAVRKLSELLVQRKGNESEKHGIAFGMYPAWAMDEAEQLLATPTVEQEGLIETMVHRVFRRNVDRPELEIAKDIIRDAEPAARELGFNITAQMIKEFMFKAYPQLRQGGNPGRRSEKVEWKAPITGTEYQAWQAPSRQTRQPTIEEKPWGGPQPIQMYGMVMMFTQGFHAINERLQAKIMEHAMKSLSPGVASGKGEPSFIVYDPDFPGPQRFEDQGRSIHVPTPELAQKVYAKLDDYGSAEALSESMGQRVGTKWVVTFMLAEEY